MKNERDKKLTGYPSIDKPWLKYYSEEAVRAEIPTGSIYENIWGVNKDNGRNIAIEYLGAKISYDGLFRKIDEAANGFWELGVRPNEIVTIALPDIPENIFCIYALNKIGAIANLIDLRSKREAEAHYHSI